MCHGVKIRKEDAKSFCQRFIRCNTHINKPDLNIGDYAKHLDTTSSSDADDDFVQKKKKKIVKGTKQKVTKVATPCFYDLTNMSNSAKELNEITNKKDTMVLKNINLANKDNTLPHKNNTMATKDTAMADNSNRMSNKNNTATRSDTDNYSDSVLVPLIDDNVERMDSTSVRDTANSIVVEHGEEEEDSVMDVSASTTAGITKVGVIDGEKDLINISPHQKPLRTKPVQSQQLTRAQQQQIAQAIQYIRSQPKVPPKNTQKMNNMNDKKDYPSCSKPKTKAKSKFSARSDLLEGMNNSDSDFNC